MSSVKARNLSLHVYLADSYALYLKVQNAHWNIVSADFIGLHKLFQEIYEELAESVDEIAERLRAVGEFVDGTFSGFEKLTEIRGLGGEQKRDVFLNDLIVAHESALSTLSELAKNAEGISDLATMDLAGRRQGVHEKFLWILKSSL